MSDDHWPQYWVRLGKARKEYERNGLHQELVSGPDLAQLHDLIRELRRRQRGPLGLLTDWLRRKP